MSKEKNTGEQKPSRRYVKKDVVITNNELGTSITVDVAIDFSNCTDAEVDGWAVPNRVIALQAIVRPNIGDYKDGQTIEYDPSVKRERGKTADPVGAVVKLAAAAGMSIEEFLKAELAKRK